MVKLSVYKKRDSSIYRLTFKVCFPDGGIIYRYRTYTKKILSQHKKQVATEIEAATSRLRYDAKDLIVWQNEGLISKEDATRLGAGNAQEKNLQEAITDYQESWDVSAAEIKSRKSRLKNIAQVWGEKTRIASLTHQDGIRLRRVLAEERGLSKPTVNKHVQEIKRLFDLALANGVVTVNPMARVPSLKIDDHEKFKPTAITAQDVSILLQFAAENDKKAKGKIRLGGFLELFLLFYFGCGMRRSELLKLEWSMIDLDHRLINLPGSITKNRKPRKVGIGHRLYTELLKLSKKSGPVVQQYHPSTITDQIKKFFVQHGYNIRLHDARHTFSTILQGSGASKEDTRDRLGHSDLEMTEHYTHLVAKEEEFEILEDKLPFMSDKPDKVQ
jgi:integrase